MVRTELMELSVGAMETTLSTLTGRGTTILQLSKKLLEMLRAELVLNLTIFLLKTMGKLAVKLLDAER